MMDEYEALLENDTWSLVSKPDHHNIIDTKWVFKVKENSEGKVDRLKARLVDKGFHQVSGGRLLEDFYPCHQTFHNMCHIIPCSSL